MKVLLSLVTLFAVILVSCGSRAPSEKPPTNALWLGITSDNDPEGYPEGATINITFLDSDRRPIRPDAEPQATWNVSVHVHSTDRLVDDLHGTAWLAGNELVLDFRDRPDWHLKLDGSSPGGFAGRKGGFNMSGEYAWFEIAT